MEEKWKGQPVRHCRKCLTRDMDWDGYFDNLHSYIDHLNADSKVEGAVKKQF
mgnify:CR=1 FL=1